MAIFEKNHSHVGLPEVGGIALVPGGLAAQATRIIQDSFDSYSFCENLLVYI